MIIVRNNHNGITEYKSIDALIESCKEWVEENSGMADLVVTQDDRLVIMAHQHFGFHDGDTIGIIIKDELPKDVDVQKLVALLKKV